MSMSLACCDQFVMRTDASSNKMPKDCRSMVICSLVDYDLEMSVLHLERKLCEISSDQIKDLLHMGDN